MTLFDIACGTGNQQIANRGLTPNAKSVGLDGSLGKLRRARHKMPDIAWVHGDSAALPVASGSFDFVSCQYAFHHFRDKADMLRTPSSRPICLASRDFPFTKPIWMRSLARWRMNIAPVVGAGFVLQIDAPDLAMERVLVYQDKSDAEFVEITPVATPAHGIVKDAHRVPAPAKRRIEKATESDAGSRLGH